MPLECIQIIWNIRRESQQTACFVNRNLELNQQEYLEVLVAVKKGRATCLQDPEIACHVI